MVDIARYFMEFCAKESCGKCPPCRIGTTRALGILEGICKGEGALQDIERLGKLAQDIQKNSLCGLGQTSANPVLTTLEYFHDEYEAHIKNKRCPAGVCSALIEYTILARKCVSCAKCKAVCPVKCIDGKKDIPYTINHKACIKCGACIEACPAEAIIKG